MEKITHTFDPVYNQKSKILILGTFPSVKSRENQFYYGHPQNRFWKVLSNLYQEEVPESIQGKKEFLLRNHVALWDVISVCEIVGSSDASIQNEVPNDISIILNTASIQKIVANGATAYQLAVKYYSQYGIDIIKLPSTSPANAGWTQEKLFIEWEKILRSKQ